MRLSPNLDFSISMVRNMLWRLTPASTIGCIVPKAFRFRAFLLLGVQIVPIAPLAPLTSLQAAMTRQSRTGILLNPQERLSLDEALPLFTTAGAWMGFAEKSTGSISPGKRADLVILDGDLLTTPPDAIHALQIATTIVGGEIVWSDSANVKRNA